jgi:nucleoside-diphosphate-sugar epimerase
VSAYIGDGSNHWPAVHRLDAAHLVRLAVESAPGGTSLHAVAEQGVPTRAIAEAIGAGLGLPVVSVSPEDTAEHFGWMGAFFGMNSRASSMITRKLLGWNPTHPTLLEDLAEGSYFRTV